jgi:alcohol dehydrogenase (cytochrome c)
MDRLNAQILSVKPYLHNINWTKGIDEKTGRPLDYDPSKDVQTYAGVTNFVPGEPLKKICPSTLGGNNFWPSSYSPRTKLLYIPSLTHCETVVNTHEPQVKGKNWISWTIHVAERSETKLIAADPITGEIKKIIQKPYPNTSGTLVTGGGLVFQALLDGTISAHDDTTLDELWQINLGTGFSAPPITFEVNGRQYVAITSGGGPNAKHRVATNPELKDQANATVLYVFGL